MLITRRRLAVTAIGATFIVFILGLTNLLGTDPGWNEGKEPWEEHPSQSAARKFNPDYTMLLYMDVQRVPADDSDQKNTQLQLRAIRLQFPAQRRIDTQGNVYNDWESNKTKVLHWINQLNNDVDPVACEKPEICQDGTLFVRPGLRDLKFFRPHHFVIYIRNSGVEFEDRPIWFGGRLRGSIYNGNDKKGDDNWSFFASHVYKDLAVGTPFSKQLIYVKNYYHVRGFLGLSHKEITDEKEVYSLNINALVKAAEEGGMSIPIVIDPDTGNGGEGEP